MGVEEANGLTLEGLAQRLEALERKNERMRSENDTLRDEDGERASEASKSEEQVSRRWLLSKAGAATVAAVAAGTLLNTHEAKAHDLGGFITADNIRTHWIEAGPHVGSGHIAVWGSGLYGGVGGDSRSADHPGVIGQNLMIGSSATGVLGKGSIGVLGEGMSTDGSGVLGKSTAGPGVRGESQRATGVQGTSSAPNLGAVEGHNDGGGSGVVGVGRVGMLAFSHTDGWIAAWGRHTANGIGVAGDSAKGTGVNGESTSGYGGQFKGGKAQLRLVPGGSTGVPTTGKHTKGEIYMDSDGTLFICWASSTSTEPAKWRKVATTAV